MCRYTFKGTELQIICRNSYFELQIYISLNAFLDAYHQSDFKNV